MRVSVHAAVHELVPRSLICNGRYLLSYAQHIGVFETVLQGVIRCVAFLIAAFMQTCFTIAAESAALHERKGLNGG